MKKNNQANITKTKVRKGEQEKMKNLWKKKFSFNGVFKKREYFMTISNQIEKEPDDPLEKPGKG